MGYDRRRFLKTAGAGVAALAATNPLRSRAHAASSDNRPNILFCLADDWGWPHAGAYGDKVVQTPTFDRLAREGGLFDQCFVSSPSCSPSRNATLTGQQFYRLGQGANLHSPLDASHPNFMFMLRNAGYAIGHHSKAWGPGNFRAGRYTENPCGPGMSFEKFMKNRPEDRPFCFWLGTTDPHRGYSGPGDIDTSKVEVPPFLPDVEEVRKDIAAYYQEVQRWDGKVGRAVKLLEETGELENTIIVMTGDHGFPFPRGKGNLYDYGVRVPLAVRWGAQVPGGRRVSNLVSFTDFAPTFLDAAGVDVPDVMTGRSLVEVLTSDKEGRVEPARDFIVFGRERHTPAQEEPSMVGYPSRAIRTDGWLYIMNLEPHRWPAGVPEGATHPMGEFADCDDGPTKSFISAHRDDEQYRRFYELCFARRPADELYDMENDPVQLDNLADQNVYHEVCQSLENRLMSYLRRTDDPRFTDAPVKFDNYPYRTGYLDQDRLEKLRRQQRQDRRLEPPF